MLSIVVALLAVSAAPPVERFASIHPGSQRIAAPDAAMLVHASGFSADVGAASPADAARKFLAANGAAFGVHGREALVIDERQPAGAVHVLRTIDGLPLFGGDLVVGVDAKQRVFLVNASPVAAVVEGRHRLSQEDADRLARASFARPIQAGPAVVVSGWRTYGRVIRPVHRVLLIATDPAGDFRIDVDAETGRALFAEDLRFRATAPASVFEVSPVESKAGSCPVSGGKRTQCASPVGVTLANLTSGSDLTGLQTSVYNCKGANQPTSKAGVPGTCSAVNASGGAFNFFFDATSVSLTDDFAAAMAYYHLDRHVSFFKAIDPTLPPSGTTSNGQSRALRGSLPALVNTRSNGGALDNAFFSGGLDAMVFGQGATADYAYDATVMYHEFTHGVVFAWGGMSPDIDAMGGYDEGGALNEGTADAMAVSETGRSEIGAYVAGTESPPSVAMRDLADPTAARSAQGNGAKVSHFGATVVNGVDGEVHDDGEIWNGFFWEVFSGLREANVKGCSGACEAATALQYHAIQLAAGTAPSFASYAATMKAAASSLFPSLPAIADYVGCVAHRRQLDSWNRVATLYSGETRVQYVRLRYSPFQFKLSVTGASADLGVCSALGTASTIHARKGAPVLITSVDPNTAAATFTEDDSGTFTQKCSAGETVFSIGPGDWYFMLESPKALVGQDPGEEIFKLRAGTSGVAVRPSAGTPATCTVSVPLALQAEASATPPKGTIKFTATGGAGGNTWSLVTNASGGTVTSSGVYTAGATGSVTDVVQVKDSAGTALTRSVAVGPGVSIAPGSATLKTGAAQTFAATGGSGSGFAWSLQPNNSGGSIDGAGAYIAGSKGGVSDTVLVVDSLGNSATAVVTVNSPGGGCSTLAGKETFVLLYVVYLAARRRRGSAR